ncbi:hypothetical protein BJ138DRAFT_1155450 [Hygrophoropsis aurantiaca]|uniref:Uncharacterized protein n=1 Tax=Hygrophoropsis aurantiaca TaxID=72124 RepID=A0ACB8A7A5_9AGAM|nr:hypothetical protein BJ138DRAFT_1155450 [Hygrophoropsis aurantiaca]
MFKFNFDIDLDFDGGEGEKEHGHEHEITASKTEDKVENDGEGVKSFNSKSGFPNEESLESYEDDHGHEHEAFTEISLDYLLSTLPPLISYSPIVIPIPAPNQEASKADTVTDPKSYTIRLHRRDLFDARFQVISSDTVTDEDVDEEEKDTDNFAAQQNQNANSQKPNTNSQHLQDALRFLDAPSDVVPYVYEGGLKTWECALDLVVYMENLSQCENQNQNQNSGLQVRGKRVLEIGCGTAIPSLYILQKIFSSSTPDIRNFLETHIHLQDYNSSVLELVTLPNVLLTWYFSPASAAYRASLSTTTTSASSSSPSRPSREPNPNTIVQPRVPDSENSHLDADSNPDTDQTVSITSTLLSFFRASLKDYGVHLRFFSGSWEGFVASAGNINFDSTYGDQSTNGTESQAEVDHVTNTPTYDLVLTSETVYRTECLPSLVRLMRGASVGPRQVEALPRQHDAEAKHPLDSPYLCLVAAKVVYFGVGGGVAEFVRCVEDAGSDTGRVETVWEHTPGVGRRVMRVLWD